MDDVIRQERCALVAAAVIELMPAVIEGKSDAARLRDALGPISAISAVVAQGSDGIADPAYQTWLRVAAANLARMEAAVRSGDADAAFAALRDPEAGLVLLSAGCAGCAGW